MITAIYPGSFDPITLGHVDIITRASRLFERVVMAVVANPGKQPLISIDKRVELVKDAVRHLDNVDVESFDGLTVNLAKLHNARVIVRGLRAVSDFEYEFMMSQMNRNLSPETETVFLTSAIEYQFLTSSMVKEVAQLGGDVSGVLPPHVMAYLREHRVREAS